MKNERSMTKCWFKIPEQIVKILTWAAAAPDSFLTKSVTTLTECPKSRSANTARLGTPGHVGGVVLSISCHGGPVVMRSQCDFEFLAGSGAGC